MKRGLSFLCVLVALTFVWLSGCAIVPRYQRETFANPAMDPRASALEDRSLGKLHASREVAAGGDGRPAGGGCACGN